MIGQKHRVPTKAQWPFCQTGNKVYVNPDPDPHSQNGSGYKTAKSRRIHTDLDQQHCS
jgi:cytochrome c1